MKYEVLRDKTLALFFTTGVSLKTWYDAGIIIRDTALYNEISKHLKHIYFFTYGGKEDLQFKNYLADNITIIPVPFLQTSRSKSKIVRLFMLIYSILLPFIHYKVLRNVDFIKSHQMRGGLIAAFCKILFRKKQVARCGFLPSRSTYPERTVIGRIIPFINDMLVCRLGDVVCVPSKGEADYIEKKFKVPKNKIYIHPNWIDTNRFRPLQGIPKVKGKICFVARFEPRKQPLLLLEAVKGLINVELLMVGGGSLEAKIKKRMKEYDIKGKVVGRVPNEDLPSYLNSCEMYILLSFWEGGSPKTLLEAMTCGLPVIGTNVDGIKEVIEHGKNGILCENNSNSIRGAIVTLMEDDGLERRIGGNARKTIEERFSLEKLSEKELELYSQLLA